ncbi:hypothetical protein Poli38472_000908 [Pythium oligandrum]|uniref:Uncharacterized protein n=1 Tax=Pythium oligandrum TaxID=41045 RepID=A0A8K1CDF5_PYTOL|nr:hypothetical protein Poli38472_000908 [Pythium oligandrum]|eukprot:TMW60866.1 hypothetical protein Poli38472_000908 [Pythium oligandrum]
MGPRSNLTAAILSGVTGMTLAGVSLLAYVRFAHPEQFAETSVRMSHPELADEVSQKWGLFGTGLADAIPDVVKDALRIKNLPERIEAQKKKREEQIRQTIEDFRPKEG